MRPDDLGHCAKLETREIGSDTVTVFSQVGLGESEVSTIVIRGATSTVLQDVERAIDDGVNMVRAMTRNGKFVAGAGACEIELARQLSKYAANTPGLEQYAIEKYAEALEVVPRTLAENTGLNDSEIISKLYKAHETGNDGSDDKNEDEESDREEKTNDSEDNAVTTDGSKGGATTTAGGGKDDSSGDVVASNFGVDIISGGVRDMTKEGVIDLMATRQMGVKLATNAAMTILRVDHIIMKKPSVCVVFVLLMFAMFVLIWLAFLFCLSFWFVYTNICLFVCDVWDVCREDQRSQIEDIGMITMKRGRNIAV